MRTCHLAGSQLSVQPFTTPARQLNADTPSWLRSPPVSNHSDDLTYNITQNDVEAKLKHLLWQSFPNSDGVGYSLWKATITASSALLTGIFNTCLVNSREPGTWKRSNIILMHKTSDESQPGNWRPISLQPTFYKIYICSSNGETSGNVGCRKGKNLNLTKGISPHGGLVEQSYVRESLMCDAKRRRKNARIT